jgi:hypothetical protein
MVRIDRLGPADLDHYYATLTKLGLKPLTVRKSHAVLSAALHQAVKWGWIDRNPADRSSPPARPPTCGRRRWTAPCPTGRTGSRLRSSPSETDSGSRT